MTRALILSGAGRYADPWHPYGETSRRLAGILEDSGLRTEISGDVDERMAALHSDPPDLLVVNVGDPALNFPDRPAPDDEERGRSGLLAYLAAGRPLLGMHAAVTSLRGVPEWPQILGGRWVRGRSFHPEYARMTVQVNESAQPLTVGLSDFDVADERYTDLSLEGGSTVLAAHAEGHVVHPLVWARTWGPSSARVVCDLLGHDGASYESPGHRELIGRSVGWLLRKSPVGAS